MLECAVSERPDGIKRVVVHGRIDALTAPYLQKCLDELVQSGKRQVVADMNRVTYVSSAGLRVFLSVQKQLKKIGGEIVFLGVEGQVRQIFAMSGLNSLFQFAVTEDDLTRLLGSLRGPELSRMDINGIRIEYLEGVAEKGDLFAIGSSRKVSDGLYKEKDVISMKARDMPFGCGFAGAGGSYDECKFLFGESMVIDGNFFFYPAVKRSSVDYLLNAGANLETEYRFLYGFGFSGPYNYVLSFEAENGAVRIDSLMDGLLAFCKTSVLGVVLLGESKGIWGMHLKRAPLFEQRPLDGKSIFEGSNFSEWVDFPVEPTSVNEVIAVVGIAATDSGSLAGETSRLLPEGSRNHLHAGLFGRSPLSKDVRAFNEEMSRIFNDLSASKIVHLLDKSMVSSGLVALIDLVR